MWVKSLLLAAALCAMTVPAHALAAPQPFPGQWIMPVQDRGAQRQHAVRPLPEVVESLRAQHGGELINARLEDGDRPIYVIRWRMPDGQVRDFRVDARR